MLNTRTVRASVIGQRLMRVFGKKRGKQLIKSLTHAMNNNFYVPRDLSDGRVDGYFYWEDSSQGHEFWYNINNKLRASKR